MNRHCTAVRELLSKLGTPTDGVVFNKKMPIDNNAIYKMSMQIHEILGSEKISTVKMQIFFCFAHFQAVLISSWINLSGASSRTSLPVSVFYDANFTSFKHFKCIQDLYQSKNNKALKTTI